jgi:hypothetical protein
LDWACDGCEQQLGLGLNWVYLADLEVGNGPVNSAKLGQRICSWTLTWSKAQVLFLFLSFSFLFFFLSFFFSFSFSFSWARVLFFLSLSFLRLLPPCSSHFFSSLHLNSFLQFLSILDFLMAAACSGGPGGIDAAWQRARWSWGEWNRRGALGLQRCGGADSKVSAAMAGFHGGRERMRGHGFLGNHVFEGRLHLDREARQWCFIQFLSILPFFFRSSFLFRSERPRVCSGEEVLRTGEDLLGEIKHGLGSWWFAD